MSGSTLQHAAPSRSPHPPDAAGRALVRIGAVALLAALGAVPARAQMEPGPVRALVDEHAVEALDLFRDYLRIPNDGRRTDEMVAMTTWVEGAFRSRGFATSWLDTPGLPLLLAERRVESPSATLLVYLQADGQPVDPAAWDQPDPYEPVLRELGDGGARRDLPWSSLAGERDPDWRIHARSASDSKGPNIQFLTALDLMAEAGVAPDYDLKVIVDFEEELGSPNLPAAVEDHREALAADMLVIFDGPPHYSGRPSLKFGARGIATVTLTTYGPRVPQHSGHYGNYAPNPGQRLARLLASMKDDEGRVTIGGFYDGIEIDPEARRILSAVPDDEAEVRRSLGIAAADRVGESLQEAVQYPSLNVRGLSSGWVGDQARTIVPATATAEIDVRLVRETEGDRLVGLIREHVRNQGFHLVTGRDPTEAERAAHARLARFDAEVSYAAFRTDFDAVPGRWLDAGMRRLFGEEPVKIRTSGGSIPISPFVATLSVPAVGVPTVNPDNNQHSPNENIRVGSFLEGIAIIVSVLSEPLAPFVR